MKDPLDCLYCVDRYIYTKTIQSMRVSVKMEPQNQMIQEVSRAAFTFNSEFDLEIIEDHYENDLNFCLNMFEVCLHSVPLEINNLMDAAHEQDFIAIVTIANKLKSNFRLVGMKDMDSILYCIELYAKNSNPVVRDLCMVFENRVGQKLAVIKDEVLRIIQFLKP